MTDKEFIEFVVDERIAMLLQKDKEQQETEMMDEVDELLKNVDEETRLQMETHINLLVNQMAVSEMKLYICGLKDGVKIAKWVEVQAAGVKPEESGDSPKCGTYPVP